jgi:hypothetical protein
VSHNVRTDKVAAEDRCRKAADSAAMLQDRLEALTRSAAPEDAGVLDLDCLSWLTKTPRGDVNFKTKYLAKNNFSL